MRLYNYVIIDHTTEDKPKLVTETPQFIFADGTDNAMMRIALKHGSELQDVDFDNIEVLVRPF